MTRRRLRIACLLTTAVASGLVVAPAAEADLAPSAVRPQARTVSISDTFSIVVQGDGRPYGTGSNQWGQLTGTDTADRTTLTPLTGLPSGVRAIAVDTGITHTVVLGSDGRAYGTGEGSDGQITGTTDRTTLTPMTGLPSGVKVTAIAAGDDNSYVVAGGDVYGTGRNGDGQLGSDPTPRTSLTVIDGLPGDVTAVGVAAGRFHVVVIDSDGEPWGAGFNGTGQLSGLDSPRTSLGPITGLPLGVTAVGAAASRDTTIVLGSNGRAYGTGRGAEGQLTGTDDQHELTSMALPGGLTARSVAAADRHTIVLGSDGIPYGTGEGDDGQLTGLDDQHELETLSGPSDAASVVEVAAADHATLVRDREGFVFGTGNNPYGQLTVFASPVTSLYQLVGQKIFRVTAPRITGTTRVGRSLTIRRGTWSVAPRSYTYQWFRGSTKITGATGRTYRLKPTDRGKRLKATVTARSPYADTGRATTAPTATIRKKTS